MPMLNPYVCVLGLGGRVKEEVCGLIESVAEPVVEEMKALEAAQVLLHAQKMGGGGEEGGGGAFS